MKRLVIAASLLCMLGLSACKMQKQYECTIRDARTGEIIRKVKVVYKSECQAYAL